MYKIFSIAFLLLISTGSFGIADTSAPSGSINSPEAFATSGRFDFTMLGNVIPAEVTDITGTARDRGDSGVDWVRVQVIRETNGQRAYWDGQTFQPQPRWIGPLFDGRNWLLPDVDLSVVGGYEVRLAVQDLAGNRAIPIDNRIRFLQTIDDNTDPFGTFVDVDPFGRQLGVPTILHPYLIVRPDQSVEVPGNLIPLGLKTVRIQADDLTGIEDVLYQVYHIDSGEYWNGTGWQSSPAWERANCCEVGFFARNGDVDFDYFPPRHQDVDFDRVGDYWVRMSVRDNAGNVSTGAESEKILVRVVTEVPRIRTDRTAPTAYTVGNIRRVLEPDGTLRIPGETAASAVQDITGFASDTGGIGLCEVAVQVERRAGGTVGYWNGRVFQADRFWVYADGLQPGLIRSDTDVPWRLNDVDLTTPGVYYVRLSVTDIFRNNSNAQQNPVSIFVVE